jgi:hypothetical protein
MLLLYVTIAFIGFSIIETPWINIYPQILLPVLLFSWSIHNKKIPRLKTESVVAVLFIIAVCFAGVAEDLWASDLKNLLQNTIRIATSLMFVAAIAITVNRDSKKIEKIIITSSSIISLSILWFVLEISVVEPFVSLRTSIYQKLYDETTLVAGTEYIRSGLAPFTHMVGYQIAFCLPVSIIMIVKGKRTTIASVIVTLCLIALFFSSQRSALLGAGFGIILNIRHLIPKERSLSINQIRIAVSAVFAFVIIILLEWDVKVLGQVSIFEKLGSIESNNEAVFRFQLQRKAIELLLANPLGLEVHGLDWINDGFIPILQQSSISDADYFSRNTVDGGIAVHNGYLGPALKGGIIILLLSGIILMYFYRSLCGASTKCPRCFESGRVYIYSTFISVIVFQSSFHNGSFLTREPISLIVSGLIFGYAIARSREAHA